MTRRTAATTFALITLTSAPAWACGPTFSDSEIVVVIAMALAIPFGVISTLTYAVMSRRWQLGFWQWLRSSVASFGTAAIGAGTTLALGMTLDLPDQYMAALCLTSPLVANIAHLMWVRTGRHDRQERREESVD